MTEEKQRVYIITEDEVDDWVTDESTAIIIKSRSYDIDAVRKEERERALTEMREKLIKISDSGVCPSGWETTDQNRACENDTCAICIFDKAVESLRNIDVKLSCDSQDGG